MFATIFSLTSNGRTANSPQHSFKMMRLLITLLMAISSTTFCKFIFASPHLPSSISIIASPIRSIISIHWLSVQSTIPHIPTSFRVLDSSFLAVSSVPFSSMHKRLRIARILALIDLSVLEILTMLTITILYNSFDT